MAANVYFLSKCWQSEYVLTSHRHISDNGGTYVGDKLGHYNYADVFLVRFPSGLRYILYNLVINYLLEIKQTFDDICVLNSSC